MRDEKLEYIYRQYRRLVLETAYSVLKDFHLAQDVCQEVFIKMTPERLERLETSEQTRAYLIVVSYHRAIDYYRMVENRGEVSLSVEKKLTMDIDMDRKMDCNNFAAELFKSLKEKNKEWHTIVIRLGVYGEPQEIVARDLGISINLLRTKYHRARKWIRRHYESEYEYLINS